MLFCQVFLLNIWKKPSEFFEKFLNWEASVDWYWGFSKASEWIESCFVCRLFEKMVVLGLRRWPEAV
mgnify:CR=1 FL=1